MPTLFDPIYINKLKLRNRFLRSATVDNLSVDNQVTQLQLDFYSAMASGEIGLIISSGMFPARQGQAMQGQLGIHNDRMLPSLKKLTDTVHKNGGLIAAQLMHAGWFADPMVNGFPAVGPSPVVNPANNVMVRNVSTDEVYTFVDEYVNAGRRAAEAGFDAVQLHGAHGFLICAFLSPGTNKRTDEWGGSTENRARFPAMIIQGIHKAVGKDFPVFIKLGVNEYHPEGMKPAECASIAKMMVEAGADAIEASEGLESIALNHIRPNAVKPYYVPECRNARASISKPLFLVGGMRSLADMQQIVADGTADGVSMCRPFIRDQHLVQKLIKGTADASLCNSCNKCMAFMRQRDIHCVNNPQLVNC